jgi:hypothetical protein
MTSTKSIYQAQRAALFARATTVTLINALKILEAKTVDGKLSQEETMARAWIIDELELRFPKASDAVHDAFEAAETAPGEYVEVDYVAALLANIQH